MMLNGYCKTWKLNQNAREVHHDRRRLKEEQMAERAAKENVNRLEAAGPCRCPLQWSTGSNEMVNLGGMNW
jgi:hypothetical protein